MVLHIASKMYPITAVAFVLVWISAVQCQELGMYLLPFYFERLWWVIGLVLFL